MINEPCPRCREGKLVERTFTKTEHDTPMSIVFGSLLGIGYFPMNQDVRYVEYSCNKSCGYKREEQTKFMENIMFILKKETIVLEEKNDWTRI